MRNMVQTFEEARTFIESQRRNEKKESLDYMYALCEVYGNPQLAKKWIHVGGTNGKGSTVTFIKSILLEAGYNVGTFTSPYVVCFNERISYNNQYIKDEEIVKYLNKVLEKYDVLEQLGLRKPSFFELMTLIAFLYFKDIEELDVAVIEVGIGGLLDSTNVITPILSVIASVSFDHMNVLGHTLEEIWKNKLGIVKDGVGLVTHHVSEFIPLIEATCKSHQAPLFLVNKEEVENKQVTLSGSTFDYHDLKNCSISLLGFHQVENAILSIEAIRHLPSFTVTNQEIYEGLKNAFWPGRLEVLSKNPLIVLDGAHNIDGIARLHEFIGSLGHEKKIRLIFAVSSNKEKEEMIRIIEENVDEIIFTHFMYKRSDESANLFEMSHHPNKKIMDDLDDIFQLVNEDPTTINIFCGSLYFVSEVRARFR